MLNIKLILENYAHLSSKMLKYSNLTDKFQQLCKNLVWRTGMLVLNAPCDCLIGQQLNN